MTKPSEYKGSNPFLNIAKFYGLSYETVVCYAERLRRRARCNMRNALPPVEVWGDLATKVSIAALAGKAVKSWFAFHNDVARVVGVRSGL